MNDEEFTHIKGELSRAALRYAESWANQDLHADGKVRLDRCWKDLIEAAMFYVIAIQQKQNE